MRRSLADGKRRLWNPSVISMRTVIQLFEKTKQFVLMVAEFVVHSCIAAVSQLVCFYTYLFQICLANRWP